MLKHLSLALLLLASNTNQVTAQVTIGLDKAPNTGALLQLQNLTSSGNVTSNKGLGLPRVQLEDKLKLLPMLSATDAIDPNMKLTHKGLLVYNTGHLYYPYCKGLYVWDGSEWQPLTKKEEIAAQPTITDGENNTYTYQKIGDKYWLTQNVRSITEYAEGVTLLNTTGRIVSINPGYQGSVTGNGKGIIVGLNLNQPIPDPDETIEYYERLVGTPTPTKITLTRNEFANKFGFIYSQTASRKACPAGWRFPTEADWNNLAVSLGGWAVAGKRLKAENIEYISVDIATPTVWDAYSRCDSRNSGFNALPSGATDILNGSNVLHFGLNTRWWTDTNNKAVGLDIGQDQLLTWNNLNTFHYPVRCVRDTDPKQ